MPRARRSQRRGEVDSRRGAHGPPEAGPWSRRSVRRAGARPRRPRGLAAARRMRLPAVDGDPDPERRREHLPQPRRGRARALAIAAEAGPGAPARMGVRPRRRRASRRALGGAEADRRDRPRALDRGALPDPRRADRLTRVGRDRAAVRSRSAAEGERGRDPLHLPPSRGDLRDLRFGDRASGRETDRDRARGRPRPRPPRVGNGGQRPRPFAGHLRPERRRGTRSARGLGVVCTIATRRRARDQPRCARGRVRRPLRASRLGGSRRRRRRGRPPQARCRHDLARRGAAAAPARSTPLLPAVSRTSPRIGTRAASCPRSVCART